MKYFGSFLRQYVLFALLCFVGLAYGEDKLLERLSQFPDATVKKVETVEGFSASYHISLRQPLDHEHPQKGTFEQQIYLSHAGEERPVVLGTEGYQVYKIKKYEISHILDANQITVEHRYFNESKPDSMDWQYLTIRQAAADHHRIVQLFKSIYKGKWINSGVSKGGQTALFHRRYYPDDVDATVAYVAPIPLSFTDPRLLDFLENVGDAHCREKIEHFQRLLLTHRSEMLPRLQAWSDEKEDKFPFGVEKAFEYAVLEYPFSFWQSGGSTCEEIPEKWGDADDMFEHFQAVVPFFLYAESGISRFASFFYQAATELGYYGYKTEHLKDLLVAVPEPDNHILCPQGAEMVYKPEVMADVHQWLTNKGNNIIYIYGELDTWSGAAVNPSSQTNALKMVKKSGAHATKIASFSEADQQLIFDTLEEWLGEEIPGFASQVNRGSVSINVAFLVLAITISLFLFRRKIKQAD